jgi:uncharacterized protein (TIGR00369 family)
MTDGTSIQERAKGLLPDLLGIRFLDSTAEKVTAEVTVRDELCTVGGVIYGGAIMALADSMGGYATVLNLPAGAATTTIESKTNFLAAAPVGSKVSAVCTPLHRGRRTMVWQTHVSREDGKLVAVVTQTQMVLEARS